jgi:uncharacterized repeat protein (TIGR01451 family)
MWFITTDTTATVTDSFYVTVIISTLTPGDINPFNDTVNVTYPVVNSYDPNKKVVTPGDVEIGYNDPFTYTIYFQNTGNAPAINIRLEDIIDPNLDLATFQFLAASHNQTYTINNTSRKLTVRYPNIFLVDSTTSFDESIGYFQFRINPISGLSAGTVIENTVDIFFDFNAPITTNTTENLFYDELGIEEIASENSIKIYPNPTRDILRVEADNTLHTVAIYDLNGRLITSISDQGSAYQFNTSNLEGGIYLIRIRTGEKWLTKRFVKTN